MIWIFNEIRIASYRVTVSMPHKCCVTICMIPEKFKINVTKNSQCNDYLAFTACKSAIDPSKRTWTALETESLRSSQIYKNSTLFWYLYASNLPSIIWFSNQLFSLFFSNITQQDSVFSYLGALDPFLADNFHRRISNYSWN